ncbi:reverse transcriptase domain-containing protein [Tanacetum coccineum]
MSSSNHLIIVLSDFDIEDAFSSSNVPDYFPATPGNTSPDSSNDLTKYLLATLVFLPLHDDPYMKIVQAYDATDNELPIPPLQAPIAPPTVISPPKYIETLVESPIPISQSSSVGSSSPVRSTAPPPDYPFDESVFAETSTSEAPAMTQAAIKKLVADSVTTTLEAQAATMASTSNPNRNTRPTGTPNAYAQPMGVDLANQITWTELKRLLTNKYCPRTEDRKMEDELYNVNVKGNDLKPYVRRFQELVVLCPNMVPNTEKLLEAFIGRLPKSIEGNVTTSKP